MTDIQKLLDGTVEEVKSRLAGLDAPALAAVLAAEQAGKDRKGVIDAVEEAQTAASTKGVTYSSATDRGTGGEGMTTANIGKSPTAALTTAASLDGSLPAGITPASEFSTSGAPRQVTEIDLEHPAVDNNPRAHTSVDQNRIDFNDPVRTGAEIVADALKDQAAA